MNTTLQIRTNKKTKDKAKKIFNNLGLDMSSGINLFLAQVVNTESIPFEPRTENGFTLKREMEIIKETKYALKHGKRYTSIKEAHADLLK
ncbi:MAG: Toxin-antitoxin system, antitoxin component, ribbon-helix-helix fold protein [Parcubacteria group bacterium Athens0714_16]|nr:MAG: Toxin-antitoxin system, antitoxin component, ribbon-helix-helix fold protein [Parcubacteria group bacterium Athens0714_16]